MCYRCTICQENLDSDAAAAVKCGHVFHFHCIFQWSNQSKTCPTCRFAIRSFDKEVFSNLYFDKLESSDFSLLFDSGSNQSSPGKLQKVIRKCNTLEKKLNDVQTELALKTNAVAILHTTENKLKEQNSAYHRRVIEAEETLKILRRKCSHYDALKEEKEKVVHDFERTKQKLAQLQHLKAILHGSDVDVEQAVDSMSDDCGELKKFVKVLRTKLSDAYRSNTKAEENVRELEKKCRLIEKEKKDAVNLTKEMKQEILLLRSRSDQTPFNPKLKSYLVPTPDTPQTTEKKFTINNISKSDTATPSFCTENILTRKRLLSKVDLNRQMSSDDEDMFASTSIFTEAAVVPPKKQSVLQRPNGFGGSVKVNFEGGFKRTVSFPNPKKPKTSKITDFPMRKQSALDATIFLD